MRRLAVASLLVAQLASCQTYAGSKRVATVGAITAVTGLVVLGAALGASVATEPSSGASDALALTAIAGYLGIVVGLPIAIAGSVGMIVLTPSR